MLYPVAFFLSFRVIEPLKAAHEVARYASCPFKPHALPDGASGRQLMVYSHYTILQSMILRLSTR